MFEFSKKIFKFNGPMSASLFSEEFMENGLLESESEPGYSESWATTMSSDAEKFFTAINTTNGSTTEFFEADTAHDTLAGLELVGEEDGEARLTRIMSWVAKGYNASSLGVRSGSWTLEDEIAYRRLVGDGELNLDPGREKLERWAEILKARKRMRNLEVEQQIKREKWRKTWRGVKKSVSVNFKRGGGDEVVVPESSRNDRISKSCVSDAEVVKKGDKLFRARRRTINVFRKVERPVESVIAQQRFVLE